MRTWRAAVAAGLLLLVPLASAADAGPVAVVTVSELQVAAGTLDGSLAGLIWLSPSSQNITRQLTENRPDPTQPGEVAGWANDTASRVANTQPRVGGPGDLRLPNLSVSAARARITVHEADQYGYHQGEVRSTTVERTDLRIEGRPVGDDDLSRLMVVPMGNEVSLARLDGALAANAVLSDPGDTKSHLQLDHGIDLASTVRAVSTEGASLAVTGSFRLVLNAVEVPYRSAEGEGLVDGRPSYATEPAAHVSYGSLGTGVYTNREAVVELWDATLVFGGGRMHIRQAALATPSIDLKPSEGQVAGQAAGASVQAEGDLVAALAYDAGNLSVAIGGRVVRLVNGGQDVPVPHTATPDIAAGPGPGALGLAVLLLAIPALPAAHWAAGRRRFTKMDRALDRGEFQAALRLADRFTPWPGQRQDSVLAAAICLIGLGRPAEACERLSTGRWSAGRRPMRDFLRARGHAALGEVEEATRALAASLLAEPSLAAQARTDPILAALVEGSRDPASSQEAYA
jgi:hypothetical protein